MAVVKNKSTEENKEFWAHVETVAREVSTWPNWKNKSTDEPNSGSQEHGELEEPQKRFGT
jgi:hypothetical protein